MFNVLIREFAPKQTVADQNALEQFQKQWSTYQKLVDADALSHRASGKLLHDTLCAIPTPFTFVDIACGDASQIREVLHGAKSRHYHGIDLSAPALELASKNLANAPFEVELDHEDFLEALTKRPEPADAAWCSLSIHHLPTEEKRRLLGTVRRCTARFCMIYEPTLEPSETRDKYLERFQRVNQPAWSFLTPEEWAQIDHHVTTSDLPETASTWLTLGREAGFANVTQLFLDPTGFYGLYRSDV
jgi:ubiquinone/menaquinone biosynthesis C-methylase UbiE